MRTSTCCGLSWAMDGMSSHVVASQRSLPVIPLSPRAWAVWLWNRHKHFSSQRESHASLIRFWVIFFSLIEVGFLFFVSPIARLELTFHGFPEPLIIYPVSIICMAVRSCSCCCWNCMFTLVLKHLYYGICAVISSRKIRRNICFNVTLPESECVSQ